jgi:hypothetical protein
MAKVVKKEKEAMKAPRHKLGASVRILSKEWMDEQEKVMSGCIVRTFSPGESTICILPEMQAFAGKEAKITHRFRDGRYLLDIDDGLYRWPGRLFDPDYKPV